MRQCDEQDYYIIVEKFSVELQVKGVSVPFVQRRHAGTSLLSFFEFGVAGQSSIIDDVALAQ